MDIGEYIVCAAGIGAIGGWLGLPPIAQLAFALIGSLLFVWWKNRGAS